MLVRREVPWERAIAVQETRSLWWGCPLGNSSSLAELRSESYFSSQRSIKRKRLSSSFIQDT